jgi:hypothetical protein
VDDYTGTSGTLTWAANTSSPKYIVVPLVHTDIAFDLGETFTVTLINPVNATIGLPSVHTVTLTNVDPPPV